VKQIRWLGVLLGVACLCSPAKADSISAIANELTATSALPLVPGVAESLASDILAAQQSSCYGSALSLSESIDSVLKAIQLEANAGIAEIEFGATGFGDLAFLQAGIAINPDVSIGFSVDGAPLEPGSTLNFGSAETGDSTAQFTVESPAVPEPTTLIFLAMGLLLTLLSAGRRYLHGFRKEKIAMPRIVTRIEKLLRRASQYRKLYEQASAALLAELKPTDQELRIAKDRTEGGATSESRLAFRGQLQQKEALAHAILEIREQRENDATVAFWEKTIGRKVGDGVEVVYYFNPASDSASGRPGPQYTTAKHRDRARSAGA
jgi:hypothetical protein